MAKQNLVINVRIEEVPTLAQFTIDSLTRDSVDFNNYKPAKYGGNAVINDLIAKKAQVIAVVFPKQLTAELKVITARIIENELKLRPLLDRLEGYVRDAAPNLTIGVKDFGISQVRKQIGEDDQEGLDLALLYLEGNINVAQNLAALQAVGYQNSELTQLTGLHTAINNDNAAQNAKEQQRALLVQNNMTLINELCKVMKDVWADGKSIYKSTNKVKVKDYTLAQLKNRIRQDELRTKITGTVKNFENVLQSGASVKARPVIGLRGKTVKSNASGVYELKGLKPGTYNLTVTLKSGQVFNVQADAITAETVTANLVAPQPNP